eukprot:TCONS_00056313-protein
MEKEIFAVSDVYEHAASIGKDIEQIVQEYGKEAIEDIMPKIVYVLEQLETLAERHQDDQEKLAGLMIEREKFMIHANRDKAIQRQLEEKLAYMEGLVTKDKKDMEQKLKRLEHENDSLVEELEKHGDGESIKSSKEKNKSGKKKRQFFFWLMDAILSGKLSFYKGTSFSRKHSEMKQLVKNIGSGPFYWVIPNIVCTPFVEEVRRPGWSSFSILKIQGGQQNEVENPGW